MKIEKPFGSITYHLFKGYIFISQFTVYKKYRKRGFGYKLAKLLPNKCWLMAQPNEGNDMKPEELRKFYRKLGFKFYWCENRCCYFGFKGFAPNKIFLKEL